MQNRIEKKLSSNSFLVALLSVPTAIIIAVGIAIIVVLLRNSAARLDASREDTERRLAQSVVTTLESALQKNVADYANWDDMYDKFAAAKLDAQWTKENLGPYAVNAFDISDMLVVRTDGSISYNYSAPSENGPDAVPGEHAEINAVVQSIMKSWRPGNVVGYSGVASYRGQPHLVAISAIAVNSEKRMKTGAVPTHALIFMRQMNSKVLSRLATDFGLVDLHVADNGMGMVPLAGPLGAPTGFSLKWTKSDEGTAFFKDAIPSILLVGAAVIAMFIVLGFGWAMVIGRIRKIEMRAIHAEDTSEAQSMFIANMSHELRTPLNAIIGFSELISKEIFGALSIPKYREYASDIYSSGNHLLGVVNNLLLFSKMEARQHRVLLEPVSLKEEVSDIVRVMQVEADRRNIRLIQTDIPEVVMIYVDQQSLRQILFNVIGNALKFTEPETEVRVEAGGMLSGGYYELRIVDQGCGIPEKTLGELGNAFVQAENTYARKYQGTGLGLAICFGLADLMGASLKVASTENVGTTISLTLPTIKCERLEGVRAQGNRKPTVPGAAKKTMAA
jgi:signal transduction histidine kinase/sensor domain CHASE-containing protein